MTQDRQTMKAARMHAYGGPEILVLEDAPIPEPGPGEVRVRVRAAGVNPFDRKVRAGFFKTMIPLPLPAVLGGDVAGVVDAVGPGVTGLAPGDAVYGGSLLGRGSYAQRAISKAGELARMPRTLDFLRAASVPTGTVTAWQALFDAGGLVSGQTVLIHGLAGNVGRFALQLAKKAGARVLGTAKASDREDLVRLGAAEVIDYRTARFEDMARDVDLVFDTQGGETQERSWGVLKKGGTLVSIVAPPSDETARARGVRATFISAQKTTALLEQIAARIDEGALDLRPIQTLPLAEAAEAHRLLESGQAKEKLVLVVDG
jgi:NADPH:quinone reductase-like Zn-dependent oxidoreductase